MISCDLHDYLEIACVYKMELKLETKSGETFFGKALDINLSTDRKETLLLEDNRKAQFSLPVDSLKSMTSLFPSHHFNTVVF